MYKYPQKMEIFETWFEYKVSMFRCGIFQAQLHFLVMILKKKLQ